MPGGGFRRTQEIRYHDIGPGEHGSGHRPQGFGVSRVEGEGIAFHVGSAGATAHRGDDTALGAVHEANPGQGEMPEIHGDVAHGLEQALAFGGAGNGLVGQEEGLVEVPGAPEFEFRQFDGLHVMAGPQETQEGLPAVEQGHCVFRHPMVFATVVTQPVGEGMGRLGGKGECQGRVSVVTILGMDQFLPVGSQRLSPIHPREGKPGWIEMAGLALGVRPPDGIGHLLQDFQVEVPGGRECFLQVVLLGDIDE